ncbi:MAG TPA: hypothetical protein VEB40_09010 [Flavipsychrobacter sp.]|nr:hypothetical protein [Flavipsychrobacter sp.]
MGYIHSTEFSCRSCSHTGHFQQTYGNYRVSDIATCPHCAENIDVSRARGIEKWNQRLSFTITNNSQAKKAVIRLGGTKYDILPGDKISVSHYGNELFEFMDERQNWQPWSSVWYRCYHAEWSSIDMTAFAYHTHTDNVKSSKNKSWW